ncbi:thymidylate synthase [Saitoella complicata NRRL Y-17804]|uniref:thymidylate synthase n=1 Tax=Saitoella complicata (strain BCRC 22490 / CBS 7301 / JCM 7358 / NBRC 10748 / NRRL Y-17804) TaxID=698492 RepID=A0A0E9NRZ9_SAICN|nr:thymidylate synthase [Saitoella complicata NRRL Y-17804]ODQ55532.1 thymidylate synthase [Saitoella complicata NRRL Y-17804]GAO52657.1 hypothetical protein G7K_6729-t1 [Saitoella complicata NRRL Y-17804]
MASHDENQYLDLIRNILENGETRPDRTGTGTRSIFAPPNLRFNLRDGQFPLLTTKRVFLRAVIEELLWFIAGTTTSVPLTEKGIHIWDGNSSRAYLNSLGLTHRAEGDLGPIYGFQWRHFGASYTTHDADYTGQGIDQLAEVVRKVRDEPWDRRIIMSAWNPVAIPEMALPPCHVLCQFSVNTRNEVSCLLYQRSADMGLGIPFNIASYALLTYMIAHITGRTPGDLIIQLGDAHVYNDHVEALQEQLQREPRPFPTLRIKRSKEEVGGIDGFAVEDFVVEGYKPYPKIEMKMSV